MVDRDVEEALHLTGMEVHREHAVGAGDLQHLGDELGRDRLARARLLVLARVREVGHDRCDALGGGELRGVDHDQELHQVPVDRLGARLHEEEIRPADRLAIAAVGLAVGEGLELDGPELDTDLLADPLGERPVRAAREEHEPLLRPALEPVAG